MTNFGGRYVHGGGGGRFLINEFGQRPRTEFAPTNPWDSRSPEFMGPSPLPEFNYLSPIEVVGEPYDYGLENATYAIVPSPAGD